MKAKQTPTGLTVFGLTGPWPGLITAHYDSALALVSAELLNGRKTRKLKPGGVLWSRVARYANQARYQALR